MDDITAHHRYAEAVRAAVTGGGGVTDVSLRAAVLARAGEGTPIAQPYDALVQQISEAAYRVTDAQVADVRAVTGSDKSAFEIIMSACIGAGLSRWDAAARAIEEVDDATP